MIPAKRRGRSVLFSVIAKMGSQREKQTRTVGFRVDDLKPLIDQYRRARG